MRFLGGYPIPLSLCLWSYVGEAYDLQRQAKRLDDLEFKLLTEGKNRRADVFELRGKVEELAASLKAVGNEKQDEIQEHRLNSETEYGGLKDSSFESVSHFYQAFVKAFKNEKTLNVRTRRHMSDIDDRVESLKYGTEKVEQELQKVNDVLDGIEVTNNETLNGNRLLLSRIQEMSHQMDTITDIKSSLESYVQSVYRPKSCSELLRRGHTASGLYKVYPGTWTEGIKVYCDQESDGGGWTVFQRREDGFLDFYRGWLDYKIGFGNPLGEFWLGNENLHHLTHKCCHELRIELADFNGNQKYAKYSNFKVGPKSGDYILTATGYNGNANNALGVHNGASFATKDNGKSKRCSLSYKGGWWYTSCHSANLNGLYLHGNHTSYADGIEWQHWTGYHYSLKFVEMKFRERLDTE